MINLHDEKTWDLYKNGLTKGVFQLESFLGRQKSKELKPENIEQLSALIAIIRPGCLKSKLDGKSLTSHYIDRKNSVDKVTYIDPSLEEVLQSTYGVLVYQEQSMLIAQKLAGFDLKEADDLRKAIGKKKADLMAKIKIKFINGCSKTGIVSEEIAKEIFSWIEKSSRYAFNKSHSVSYAYNSYLSAWYKANFTKEFFLSYLYFANEKQDPHKEIYELISEAKMFDIEVKTPKLDIFKEKFFIHGKNIYFGVKDVKSLTGVTGDKALTAIKEAEQECGYSAENFSWMDVLIHLSPKINSTAFKSLISIGFFCTNKILLSRNKALYEYSIFKELTKSETDWVHNNYKTKKWGSLLECFQSLAPTKKFGGGTSSINRMNIINNEIDMIKNPPYSLVDEPSWIVEQETKILGCPVSLSKTDAIDIDMSNTTCKEVLSGKKGKNICLVATLNKVKNHKINKPNSKNHERIMSFLTIEDSTSVLETVIVFPDARDLYQFILYEGNTLLFCGEIDKDGTFIIEKIHEI